MQSLCWDLIQQAYDMFMLCWDSVQQAYHMRTLVKVHSSKHIICYHWWGTSHDFWSASIYDANTCWGQSSKHMQTLYWLHGSRSNPRWLVSHKLRYSDPRWLVSHKLWHINQKCNQKCNQSCIPCGLSWMQAWCPHWPCLMRALQACIMAIRQACQGIGYVDSYKCRHKQSQLDTICMYFAVSAMRVLTALGGE